MGRKDSGRISLTAKPLRVAAVGITPPEYKASGGITAAFQLMRRVADLCDTAMYVMADRNADLIDGCLRVALRRPTNPLAAVKSLVPRQVSSSLWRPDIKQWLIDFAPSVVHFHNPHPTGALAQSANICNELGIPYVISTHGFVEFNNFSRGFSSPHWQRPLLARYVRRPLVEVAQGAARVLMLSPQEEPILRGMGVAPERLSIVPNGVDPYFLEDLAEDERTALVSRFRLPENSVLFLFVGNHTVNKGLDVLLQAISRMNEKAVVVIAGAIRSKRENERLISNSGLKAGDSRFIFTDFISQEELRALYHSVDAFVFPSRADTLPLVILEAMASGLPVIASNVGGIPSEITPKEGILLPPGDPARLAEALDRICRDADLRRRMGDSARDRVIAKFDWNVSAGLALRAYEEVLATQTLSKSP